MTRGAAQHRSHQVASVRSDRAVLYLLRKTARLRCSSLAFASKIGSFQCFRPKGTVENFSPNLLSFIVFPFRSTVNGQLARKEKERKKEQEENSRCTDWSA